MNYERFQLINYIWMAIGVGTFLLLLFVTAPYGRHTSAKWGPQLSNRFGWMLMEVPVILLLLYFVLSHFPNQTMASWIMIGLFLFHYINRTFIFPFRLRTKGKKMPLVIVLSGVSFNLMNGSLLGYYFAYFGHDTLTIFSQPHFIIGILLFIVGVYINWTSDSILIHLRKPNETGYKIPTGGLFRWISCPNLLGEIIEWTGFALLCWNLPALSFLVWTLANLIPRALSHHAWYKKQFTDYPTERKALFPYLL